MSNGLFSTYQKGVDDTVYQLPLVVLTAPAISRTRPCTQLRRGRELTYTLRLRLPTKRLYSRTMTATMRRRWINPPPIWKASQPSNQSTTRIMTIAQRIVPNITRTPFTRVWEQRGRHSLSGKKPFLPYLHNEIYATLVIGRNQLGVGSDILEYQYVLPAKVATVKTRLNRTDANRWELKKLVSKTLVIVTGKTSIFVWDLSSQIIGCATGKTEDNTLQK
jgi:hypothetical protein